MKKVCSLLLFLFIAVNANSQPHLRITSITGIPLPPDSVFEAVFYDSIAVTIMNDGTIPFSDSIAIFVMGSLSIDTLYSDDSATVILPGNSVTKLRSGYTFSHACFDDGDNIIVVWPQAINVPVGNDTLIQPFKYVSLDAGTKSLQKDEFGLYPNPASRYIFMDEGDNISIKCVRIFDQTGRIIYKKEKMEPVIYVGDWSPGIYIIEADTRDGQRIYRKMIKD